MEIFSDDYTSYFADFLALLQNYWVTMGGNFWELAKLMRDKIENTIKMSSGKLHKLQNFLAEYKKRKPEECANEFVNPVIYLLISQLLFFYIKYA